MEKKERERKKEREMNEKCIPTRQKQFPNEASKLHAKNIRQKLVRERDRGIRREILKEKETTKTKLSAFDTGKCSLQAKKSRRKTANANAEKQK